MQAPQTTVLAPGWARRLVRADHCVYAFERAVCVLSLGAMLVFTLGNVIARNLHWNIPNIGEFGLAALIPLTLIGGAMCSHLGAHIAIEITQLIPHPKIRGFANLVAAIVAVTFAGFYLYSGFILVEEFQLTEDKLLDMGTPLWLLALCFPIGMTLLIWHSLVRIALTLHRLCTGAGEQEATA